MALHEIATGEVRVELNDRAATSGLHRLEAEYRAAMARIDRMEAEATIDVDTRQFDAKMKKEEDRIKILKAEKADVKIGADTSSIDRKILIVQRRIDRLKGERAEVEISTRGERETLATLETVRKAEAARAAANERYNNARTRMLADEVKGAEKRRQLARQEEVTQAKATQRIAGLRREYSRLDGELDKVTTKFNRQQRSLGGVSREQKIRFSIDDDFLRTRMETIKKELSFLGGHPPVELDLRFDERTIRSRFLNFVQGLARRGDTRISLGPITTSIRTLVVAGTALSSVFTSLLGSATALVGVLGTGLAGALAATSGLVAGLVLNFGGLVATLIPAVKNFKLATAATKAHDQAVAKYGANSKQAATAQRQLNSVIRQLDPNSRQALRGFNQLKSGWNALTGQTAQRNVGRVLKGGIDALRNLMPILARNTNDASNLLTNALTRWEKAAGSRSGQTIFGSLGRSANEFLSKALPGIDHLAAAFAHVAESAARIFAGPTGSGFTKWAKSIDDATQPGQRLDDQMRRLRQHASDLLHFFSALGRLMITVLNGGADAGDNLVQHMTRALDKWNAFLNTQKGQRDMAKFFSESEKNTRALFNALTPLVALFFRFSQIFQPLTTGALRALDIIGRISVALGSFQPFRGLLYAIGAGFATWVVLKKVNGYIEGIAGAITRIRRGGIRGLFGGSGTGGQIVGAFEEGSTIAARNIRAAMAEGGAVAGREIAAGEEAGGIRPGGGGGLGRNVGRGIIGRALATPAGIAGAAATITVGTIIATQLIARNRTQAAERRVEQHETAVGSPANIQRLVSQGDLTGLQKLDTFLKRNRDDYLKFGKDAKAAQLNTYLLNVSRAIERVEQNSHLLGRVQSNIHHLAANGSGDMRDLQHNFDHNMTLLQNSAIRHTQAAKNAAGRNVGAMATAIEKAISDGRISADQGLRGFQRLVNTHTGAAATITAQNMTRIANSIQSNIDKGVTAAGRGNRLIHAAFVAGFKALGLSAREIKSLGPDVTPGNLTHINPTALDPTHGGVTKAGGGYIGHAGEAGADTELAWLGRGEAVLNRHQQGPVQYALQNTFGVSLDDLFSQVTRPHNYATGGFGRMVGAANSIDHKHYPYVWGGGHSSFQGPYDCSGAVSAVLHAGGYLRRPMVSGQLANYGIPGPGKVTIFANPTHAYMRLGGRYFGTHGAEGAGWFPGAPRSGFSVRHVPATGGIATVKAPTVTGRGSVTREVRSGLRGEARGANRKITRAFNSLFGGGQFGGGDPGDAARGAIGFGGLEQLWTHARGAPGMQALMAHIALAESGGNPRAHNASGASGLWQILGQLVPGNIFNPNINALNAVAKFRTQGLGAWAASRGTWGKFLGRGGRLKRYARGRRGSPAATLAVKKSRKAPSGKHHPHKRIKPLKGFEKLTQEANYRVNEQIPALEELYSNAERTFDLTPEEFIITPPAGGDPFIDWRAVGRRKEELTTLISMKRRIQVATNHAIAVLNRILALREERKRLKARLEQLQREYDKLQKEIHALEKTRSQVHGKGSTGEHRRLSGQILDKTNQARGVQKDIQGTKQMLSDWDTTMSDAESNLTTLEGVSGRGGSLADNKFDIATLQQQLGELDPKALEQQRADQAGTGTPADTGVSPDQQAQIDQANERARVAGVAQGIAETTLQAFTGFGDIETGGRNAFAAVTGGTSAAQGLVGGAVVTASQGQPTGGIGPGPHPGRGGSGGGPAALFGGLARATPLGAAGGGGVVIHQTFNSMLPSDPDVLRQVGQAAAGGLSYQGFTGGTTVVTGL